MSVFLSLFALGHKIKLINVIPFVFQFTMCYDPDTNKARNVLAKFLSVVCIDLLLCFNIRVYIGQISY